VTSTAVDDEVEQLYRSLNPSEIDSAVSVIVKLRGETCDIDCVYCYEKRKESPGGRRIGAGQIGQLTELFGQRPLAVELHGGEPLTLGKPDMRAVLQELAASPTVVRVSMQTNAVALDDEWLDLFEECYPQLKLGISLDGDAPGNAWRIGYDGTPVYPRVVAALELLAARGWKVGIIATVTSALLGRPRAVMDHLAGFTAVNAVKFAPCFDGPVRRPIVGAESRRIPASRVVQRSAVSDQAAPAWSVTTDQFAEFVLEAGARWIKAGYHRRMSLEPIVATIRRLRGLPSGYCHFSDLKCQHVFTLYPDGRFGGCDELDWPAAKLGSLDQLNSPAKLSAAQLASPINQRLRTLMAKCVDCSYRSTCAGGCLATRLRAVEPEQDEEYCAHRMRLVDGVAGLLAAPGQPGAATCRTLRWRPRAVNSMRDIAAFLSRWDDPAANRAPARLQRSAYGNINTVGQPGTHEADDLDPRHPQWNAAIEPGVRPLVDAAVRSWRVITYDSCAGHVYEGLDLTPRIRQFGILPRDRHEYQAVANALCRTAANVVGQLPDAVALVIGRAELQCETAGTHTAVLDVRLEPSGPQNWDDYFAQLDTATSLVAEAMGDTRPQDAQSCPCQHEGQGA
jgi:uncharacterized protein